MLPKEFEEPAGFQWGTFKNAAGTQIRYGSLQPAGPVKGTMIMVPGLGEPIEKYFEVMREMTAKGFAVWMMEWRGQGGSDHYLADNPQKIHSEGYKEHIDTLHQFADKIAAKTAGPRVLTAHSMGAHVALRYLKEHDGVFDSALLSAPMFNINTPGLPRPMARQMARFAKAGNYLKKYVPGGHDRLPDGDPFDGNNKSSDPGRFSVIQQIYEAKPELKTGSPTYGWIYHTFESVEILNKEDYLKSIKTPILMQISGNETVVDRSAEERACKLLPNCTPVSIPEARHEIWMERDDLRNQWLSKVAAFLDDRLNRHGPTPKKPEPNVVHRPPKFG